MKQRVIGALVLISLAVIFIPMLFDEPHEERTTKVLPIPEKPPLPSITIGEPESLNMQEKTANTPEPGVDEAPLDAAEDFSPHGNYTITELTPESGTSPSANATQPQVAPTQSATATQSASPATPTSPAAEPSRSAPAQTQPAPRIDAGAVAEQPALDEQGLANAWTVQIGTFKSRENAYRLRDNIRAQGLKAYTREISTAEGNLVRVFAGPVLTNDEALKVKSVVDKSLQVNALVVRYAP